MPSAGARAKSLPVRPATALFRALGDETRLRIVALLSHRELCVCHIQEALGVSQPNASRQLGILRTAGVVATRREGPWVHYRIAAQTDAFRKRYLGAIVRAFSENDGVRGEVRRVVSSCGPEACE